MSQYFSMGLFDSLGLRVRSAKGTGLTCKYGVLTDGSC